MDYEDGCRTLDGWMGRQTDKMIDEQKDEWVDERTGQLRKRWMDSRCG